MADQTTTSERRKGEPEHSNRTHPSMARGAGQHPGGDRDQRDAQGTPPRAQADPQAQAALGRVTGDGAALPPRSRHVSHRPMRQHLADPARAALGKPLHISDQIGREEYPDHHRDAQNEDLRQ